MWTPFKKKSSQSTDDTSKKADDKKKPSGTASVPGVPFGMPDTKDMNMLQKFAMKRFLAMDSKEQKKMVEKMMTPKNIAKHKDEIIAQLELARKSGQMSDDQYRMAKRKFGL